MKSFQHQAIHALTLCHGQFRCATGKPSRFRFHIDVFEVFHREERRRRPPLRERKEDVQEIVEYFLGLLGQENGLVKDMDETAMGCLVDYEWPGNIRELQNEVKRLYALSEDTIQVHDLTETILQGGHAKSEFKSLERDLLDLTLKEAVERVEERMIRHALIELRGNKSLVAKKLQVPKTSLYNKINKYGLNRI